MSNGLDEVLEVPPLSMNAAENIGEAVLEEFQPEALERPTPVNLGHWVDYLLPKAGISVNPMPDFDMPRGVEAFADPDESTPDNAVIICSQSVWIGLFAGLARPRATILHEIVHAVLHIPRVLQLRSLPTAAVLLARRTWGEIPAFRNAEWQAWAVAGCIAMPRRTLVMLPSLSPDFVARTYGVSQAFARAHLRRLKLLDEDDE